MKMISWVAWAMLNLDTRNLDQLQQRIHLRILREINYFLGNWNIKGFYFSLPSGCQAASSTVKPLPQPHGRRKVSFLACTSSSLKKNQQSFGNKTILHQNSSVLSAFAFYYVHVSPVLLDWKGFPFSLDSLLNMKVLVTRQIAGITAIVLSIKI